MANINSTQVFDIDVDEGKDPKLLVGQFITLDNGSKQLHFYCTKVDNIGHLKARVTAQLVERPN